MVEKETEIEGVGRSFGKKMQFRRTFTGIEIQLIGKRGGFLGRILVEDADLRNAVCYIAGKIPQGQIEQQGYVHDWNERVGDVRDSATEQS